MSAAEAPHPDAGWCPVEPCEACRSAPGEELTAAGLLCRECARKFGRDGRRGPL
jgi:hypothetical protein